MPNEFDRVCGALTGTLIGDALGRPFEGIAFRDERLERLLTRRLQRPHSWDYSDDAEMMFAVADSLVRCGRVDTEDTLDSLLEQCEPARGYGKGVRRTLRAWRQTRDAETAARATWKDGSRGNGGVVRLAPIVAWHRHEDLTIVRTVCRRSVSTTHCHPVALTASDLFAEALWNAFRGVKSCSLVSSATELAQAVRNHGNGVDAQESAELGTWVWQHTDSFECALTTAIRAGGDTDTIGAMVGALAGALYGCNAIPQTWVNALPSQPVKRVRQISQQIVRI